MQEIKNKKSEQALREERTLSFWKDSKIFEKTLNKESPKGEFIFYEGPPTANGKPGIHHLLSRSFKDVILRYKTMQGFHVRRKGGWDTHGLPVELEVEKKLGLKSKKEIEDYGIEKFNDKCKESVWKYIEDWENFTDRMGYWIDQQNAYVTYKTDYMESVWWIFKQIFDRDLLYKDYKVVPWCPRCGTVLSSHEIAQGYKDVKDLSLFIKFKIKKNLPDKPDLKGKYFLAWTTTPWTLPGNIALAVGENIEYIEVVNSKGENLILAKERESILEGSDYEIIKTYLGKDLIGAEYEPIFPYLEKLVPDSEKDKLKKAFCVYPADFVNTEDGTGIVHTAVMYGQDDFELGNQVGLPKIHLVGEDGKFLSKTGFLEGRFVKDQDLEVDILKDLNERNLLFAKQKYEHSYPFCWRCSTPLIYYARDSWYIKMSNLREKLVLENQKINWEPEHTKEGRFGEWLREVKDWAISRERYWGTPLPIWQTTDLKETITIGSIEELKSLSKKSDNSYLLMRHGESESNTKGVISSKPSNPHHLTIKGKNDVKETANFFINKKIDYIFTSDFVRTKETAEIVSDVISLPKDRIIVDKRLREADFGKLNGKPIEELWKHFSNWDEMYATKIAEGESLQEMKRRVGDFIYDIDSKYKNKNILIITHELPAQLLFASALGMSKQDLIEQREGGEDFIKVGKFKELNFTPLPHNDDYEIDLHKPFVDKVVLISPKTGEEMRRINEVADVWFDSGAMPFAQDHYPMENKEWVDGQGFPADYIAEAIDQTRGWFYTLHAIGNLLERGFVFKNVICLGLILDKDGKKMSKSLGNVVDPWESMDKYGADILRFWMYSINQPGESKNFDQKTVEEVVKKVFNLFFNVYSFYELNCDEVIEEVGESNNILDKWILVKTNNLINDVERSLDNYKVLDAARMIRDFISDLSQWYIRRSRNRFKGEDREDKLFALSTTKRVLKNLSIVMAPFAPFSSEHIYKKTKDLNDPESVHLTNWPSADVLSVGDIVLIKDMDIVRELSSKGLEARAKKGIKVRQPLSSITFKSNDLEGKNDLVQILKDELNVKDVLFDKKIADEVLLDTEITPDLLEEGQLREFVRQIQDLRKEKGLKPDQKVKLLWFGPEKVLFFLQKNEEVLKKTVSIDSFENKENKLEKKLDIFEEEIFVDIFVK